MHERAGHLLDDLGQLGVRMAEHHAHHAGGQVVVLVAVHVDELGALTRLEDDARTVAPAEHRLGITCLEVGMRIGKPERLFHRMLPRCEPRFRMLGTDCRKLELLTSSLRQLTQAADSGTPLQCASVR